MRDGSVVVRLRLAPVLVLRWFWIGSLMIRSQWRLVSFAAVWWLAVYYCG